MLMPMLAKSAAVSLASSDTLLMSCSPKVAATFAEVPAEARSAAKSVSSRGICSRAAALRLDDHELRMMMN